MRLSLVMVVGCSLGLLACAKSVDPYTVVGTQLRAEGVQGALRIEYTIPGGATSTWERLVRTLDPAEQTGPTSGWYRCWVSAKVGEQLPPCAREEAATGTGVSGEAPSAPAASPSRSTAAPTPRPAPPIPTLRPAPNSAAQ